MPVVAAVPARNRSLLDLPSKRRETMFMRFWFVHNSTIMIHSKHSIQVVGTIKKHKVRPLVCTRQHLESLGVGARVSKLWFKVFRLCWGGCLRF